MRLLIHEGFDPGQHRESFEKVRAAIERGDLRSADLKKLSSGGFYRAKLDRSNRLLVKLVQAKDETACLALEIIENHAYDRSRFLRGAPLDVTAIEQAPPCEEVEPAPAAYLHPSRPTFHFLDRPLSLDDAQDAVYRLRPPALVVGSAGGGKTALALVKLRGVTGDALYVTQSRYLAETARGIYFSHGYENDAQSVDFLCFDDLLASIAAPEGRPVSFRSFATWFLRQRTSQALSRAGAHACFEEIRGVITAQPEGPLALDGYRSLGVKQSIFAPEVRDEVHALYERYVAWLEETGQHEPNLVARAYLALAKERYDFAVVDEAQDLTNVQLALVLRTLRDKSAFVLSGDSNQIVHPNFFSWAQVKSLLFRDEVTAARETIEVLSLNYRNSRTVTTVANALLKVKHARFGSIDRESNMLATPASEAEGSVVVLPATAPVLADLDKKTAMSKDVAVVVLRDEDKVEARRHFRTPLLFSVREAKGLEYESVVAYGIVSGERTAFSEIAEGVTEEDLAKGELLYRRARDKGDKSLETYKFFVNALYVTLTRAIKNVYVVETDTTHRLLALLGAAQAADAAAVQARRSSIEEWQREAGKLEAQGKAEQAEAIRQQILHETPVPWEVFDRPTWHETSKKALAPGSVYNKAKQRLLEAAAFHGVAPVAGKLIKAVAAARTRKDVAEGAWRKYVAPYAAKNFKDVLWQTERYGVDFRNALNMTPLMLAALAGNVPLMRTLLERGARRDLMDTFGWLAVHWAVERAYRDESYAKGPFGELYDAVAPTSFDLMVPDEGGPRLVKLGRDQGEYFPFVAMVASLRAIYLETARAHGVAARDLVRPPFDVFPVTVLSPARKRRAYLSSVLARSEAFSSYPARRRLWFREAHGEYVPNPRISIRVPGGDFVPLYEVLGIDVFDEHLYWKSRALGLTEQKMAAGTQAAESDEVIAS